MNLSDALAKLDGQSSVTATGDGGRFVVLRHGVNWRVGFRLSRTAGERGPWEMTEFATVYTGSESVTAESVRRLPIGALLAQARRMASGLDNVPAQKVGRLSLVDLDAVRLAPFLTDGRGRGKRTDEDFAGLALEYALLVADGDRAPAKTLSQRHGHGSAAVWVNRISEARRRGLLTPVKSGEAGGSLTPKAERLLGMTEEGKRAEHVHAVAMPRGCNPPKTPRIPGDGR